VLVGYLYLRFWDMLAMSYTYEPGRSEGLQMLTRGSLAFNFWVGEMLLGCVVPIIVLLSQRLRRNERLHLLALVLIIGGLAAYRWDTNMVSELVVFTYLPNELIPLYTRYSPSLIEIISGAGVIAYGLLAFTLGVRYLKVVDHGEPVTVAHHEPAPMRVAVVTTD
jgi:molybdopterin-containing oxidoreductase family membrane subunit